MDEFEAFMERVLADPDANAAYEDACAHHAVIDRLLARRNELGWSRAEVARRMGCDYRSIARFELETAQPTIQAAQMYARAVGLKLAIAIEVV